MKWRNDDNSRNCFRVKQFNGWVIKPKRNLKNKSHYWLIKELSFEKVMLMKIISRESN